jgi:hypothetical protein
MRRGPSYLGQLDDPDGCYENRVFVELLFAATLTASLSNPIPSIPEGPQPIASPAIPLPPPVPVPPPKLVQPVQPRPAGSVYSMSAEPGAALRRYGLATTVAGVTLGISGVVAAYTDRCGHDGARGSDCASDTRNAVAMILGAASFGLITGGVVAMSIGHVQGRRARLELANFGVALRGDGGGLQLGGRF